MNMNIYDDEDDELDDDMSDPRGRMIIPWFALMFAVVALIIAVFAAVST